MSVSGDARIPVLSRRCHVPGCGASSPAVVVYSAKRNKDEGAFRRWVAVLGIDDGRLSVHACQRHFPAGAPTRNHPDPNPNLFNPIPTQPSLHKERYTSMTQSHMPPIFNTAPDGTPLGPDGQPLPNPVQPPPGSVTKLAPNATLIDLNKIRKDPDSDKPFKIEQVTVLIDESDAVKRRSERVYRHQLDLLSVSDEDLLRDYRFPKKEIQMLCEELGEHLERPTKRGRAIPVHLQVLTALRFYACCNDQNVVAGSTGLSQASVSRVIGDVTEVLFKKAVNEIKMPKNQVDLDKAKQNFYRLGSFPGVVGAIDTTHIELKVPHSNQKVYMNHEGVRTLNVQFVCNADQLIMNFVAKYPGSVQDGFIWRDSNLYKRFVAGEFGDSYLLGDEAYSLDPFLLTPVQYPRVPVEETYNRSHKLTHGIAQQTAKLLKSRFRCLHRSSGPLLYEPSKCAKVIIACMWLHNRCVTWKIPFYDELQSDEPANQVQQEMLYADNPGVLRRNDVIQKAFLARPYL